MARRAEPALAGEVGKIEVLEVGQRLPQPRRRFSPPVPVGAGCDQEPGQAAEEPALEAAQASSAAAKIDAASPPSRPAATASAARQRGPAHGRVEVERPALLPGLCPAVVGDGAQQRPAAGKVVGATDHGRRAPPWRRPGHRSPREAALAEVVEGDAVAPA